jgi:hypothetical protein
LGQVLNIAEGNGKMAEADRRRYFEIARGAVLECGAIQDVLVVGKALDEQVSLVRKTELDRMAAMLSRLGGQGCCVAENSVPYGTKPEKVDPDPGPDFDFEKEKPQQGGHPTRIRAGWPLSFWRGTSGHDFSTTSRTA